MTNSFRHTRIVPNTTVKTEKLYKTIVHRQERAKVRGVLNLALSDPEADVTICTLGLRRGDNWDWGKDGKGYIDHLTENFTEADLAKAMRK